MELLVLAALVGGAILVYRFVSADNGGPDLAWGGPGLGTSRGQSTSGSATAPAIPPYRAEEAPAAWPTALALSRIEARRLLASPLIWVGVGLTALECLAAMDSGLPDQSEWLSLGGRLLPLLIFPLCGMVVIAANRAALRPRRDGTDELLDTLPARPSIRTLGLLLGLRAPLAIGAVATGALATCVWFGAGKADGQALLETSTLDLPFSDIGPGNIVITLVLVLCAGALGIGLARLLPWSFVPLLALVAVGVASGGLGQEDLSATVGGLSPLVNAAGDLPAFLTPYPAGWHVAYLLGLAGVAAGVAFLLDGDRRWGTCTLAVASALIAIAIVGHSRTYAGDTPDQIADLVTEPGDHQRCVQNASAEVCLYPELLAFAPQWLDLVTAVLDAAPAAAVDGRFPVAQRLSAEEISALDPAVQAEIQRRGNAYDWADQPGLHPDLRWGAVGTLDSRGLQVANDLVGFPEAGTDADATCYAGGQARAAIVVALAGRAAPDTPLSDFAAPSAGGYTPDSGAGFAHGDVTALAEDNWEIDAEPVVVHSESDLRVGRSLLARPVGEVRRVLAADWERWIDPATPTRELAEEFGLTVLRTAPAPEGLEPCR